MNVRSKARNEVECRQEWDRGRGAGDEVKRHSAFGFVAYYKPRCDLLTQVIDMAVFVGLSTIEIAIPDSHSLKDKRQVVRSILDRVRSRFNVSVCEADNLDNWQRATLAFAIVANDKAFAHECLMHIAKLVEEDGRINVEDVHVEIW